MIPPLAPGAVAVRMYRNILGDCLLIRAHQAGARPWHALIDFGVLSGTPAGGEKMDAILESLHADTGGELDVLAVTHEHADHIAGFIRHREAFFGPAARFTVGAIWLAWTEKRDDAQAEDLRGDRGKRAREVLRAARSARDSRLAMGVAAPDMREVEQYARFLADPGEPDEEQALSRNAVLMEALAKDGRARFLEPGETLAAGPLLAHVLGPPRDHARLFREDPREGSDDAYLAAPGVASAGGKPFSGRFALPLSEGEPALASYFAEDAMWRRIHPPGAVDDTFALQLDRAINNTSLALAFAMPDGQMLLFPADAQVGNWQSWGDQAYPPRPGEPPSLTRDAILTRVTFYKVGHHGSHNATLRADGLEKMTSGRLRAVVPVDRKLAARQPGGGWKMPHAPLAERLRQKTDGRLVLGDGDPAAEAPAFADGAIHYAPDGLWVEVHMAPDAAPS